MTPQAMRDGACQAKPLSAEQLEIRNLRHEVEMLTNAGVIECAVRNKSVAEYIAHWEGRALKAEALAQSIPPAAAQDGDKPVAWWNGISERNADFNTVQSWALKEDANHDIPLYAGINPDAEILNELKILRADQTESVRLRELLREALEMLPGRGNLRRRIILTLGKTGHDVNRCDPEMLAVANAAITEYIAETAPALSRQPAQADAEPAAWMFPGEGKHPAVLMIEKPSDDNIKQWAALDIPLIPLYAQPDALRSALLSEIDLAELVEFNSYCEDGESGGYANSKDVMTRLSKLGVVRRTGGSYYEMTAFGDYVIEQHFEQNPKLPLKTTEEHNADAARAAGGSEK